MIQKTQSFQTSDGTIHPTIEKAKERELLLLMNEADGLAKNDPTNDGIKDVLIEHLIINQERVVDILTTKASSKPKARAINGGRKVRTPKPSLPTAA